MNDFLPVLAAILLLILAYSGRKRNRLAQPLRLRLAEMGEGLLGDESLPADFKVMVSAELRHAFSMRAALLFMLVLAPVVVVWGLARDGFEPQERIRDLRVRAKFNEFVELSERITLLNHPFLYPAAIISCMIWLVPVALIAALFGKTITKVRTIAILAKLEPAR